MMFLLTLLKIYHHLHNWKDGEYGNLAFTDERYAPVYNFLSDAIKEILKEDVRGPRFDAFREEVVQKAM